jgi:hypothetical protein
VGKAAKIAYGRKKKRARKEGEEKKDEATPEAPTVYASLGSSSIKADQRRPGNLCVHQMYQKTMMIMETEKYWSLFYFNCVLRNDEVGGIFYSLHR